MLIDDRPYTTFPSEPKNEEAVASSCLNVVTALVMHYIYVVLTYLQTAQPNIEFLPSLVCSRFTTTT